MIYLRNLQQVRAHQWSQGFRWDTRFDGGPPKFSDWFPATEVKEFIYTLEHYTFSAGQSTYSIPKSTTEGDISITYVEDIRLSMEKWISQWVNQEILNDGNGLTPIAEACKNLHIAKVTNMNQIIYLAVYKVIPTGSLYYDGTSQADPFKDSIDFKIVETVNITHF